MVLLLFSYRCFVTVNVLWLLLKVPWVGLRCVIIVFPDHTHLLFLFRKKCQRQKHEKYRQQNHCQQRTAVETLREGVKLI